MTARSGHSPHFRSTPQLRCAVYTRKSSEEGLDQAFNSLDAQREAGLDYIRSQKHSGWTAIKACYDDGGYSGGTTGRPGLQRLLENIKKGRHRPLHADRRHQADRPLREDLQIEEFHVEGNNFQDVVVKDLRRAINRANFETPVRGFGSTGNKQARIQMLEPSITNGQLMLCRRHHELIEQLRQFPLGAHDDSPDALQMAMEIPASPPARFRSINLFGNRPPDPLLDPVGFLKWL